MAEAAFRSVQIGKETVLGTEVNATLVLPVETTSGELTLVRGTNSPDEDFGRIQRNANGRGSHGIRNVTGSVSVVATYEILPHLLSMALGGVVTTGSGAPFSHVIARDTTSNTAESYTWEVNDDTQDWIGTGIVIPSWELSYDALSAGANAAWMFSGDLQGATLTKGTATAALTAPACETMEGHLTTISHGDTNTAFGSLTALTGRLVSFSISGEDPKPPRPYGSASDTYVAVGRQKSMSTVNCSLLLDSTSLGATFDHFNVAGAVPTYRRFRVAVAGTGTNNDATIDFQLLTTDSHVDPAGRDGERLLVFTGETVYDATLATDLEFTITNGTTSY